MRSALFLLLLGILAGSLPSPGLAQTNEGDEATIEDMSLESLLDMEVSTASKYEQTAREAPASVSVVTAEEIERFGYRTLAEALASVRGFYLGNDLDRTYLGTRGFGKPGEYNNRVLVLLDGHTINEAATGWAPINTQLGLDMATVERIEVVRGPGSALYGTGAMFAVINVVTKGADALAGPRVSATLGSYGEQRGAVSYATALESGLDLTVSGLWGRSGGADLYFEEFDSPSTNNGVAEGRDWERSYGIALSASQGAFAVHGRYAVHEGGVSTAPLGQAFNSAHAMKRPQQGFVELSYERGFGVDKQLTLRSYIDHTRLYLVEADPTEEGEMPNPSKGFSNSPGVEAQFQWDTSLKNRLTVGAEYRYARVYFTAWRADTLYFQLERPSRVASVYAQNEYRFTRNLAATVGFRHDRYATGSTASTPRAALAYHLSRSSTLKLLYGQAFRVPSVEDLVTNANLEPERIHTIEAVWEQALTKRLSGTLSLYNFRARDLVDFALNLKKNALEKQNLGKVTARGLELGLNARFGSGSRAYARYAFQRAWNTTIERVPQTDSPEHVFGVGAVVPFFGSFYAASEARYETARLTLHGSRTDPFLLADFTLSTEPLFNHLSLSLSIRNALDTRYELPASVTHRQQALPQYGRTVLFNATYRL